MRILSDGKVGIGTSAPNYLFNAGPTSSVASLAGAGITLFAAGSLTSSIGGVINFRPALGLTANEIHNLSIYAYDHSGDTNADGLSINAYDGISFCTGANTRSERMRITSAGNVLVGNTASLYGNQGGVQLSGGAIGAIIVGHANGVGTGNGFINFNYNASAIGSITQNGTTAVLYNTSSDYRLKNTIAPMTGALAKVARLKPVTYKWNADGSEGQGFIAHELKTVVPDCVSGEKDAVDAEGKPQYQGVDTSFLVATLTAALQEQQALIEALTTRITALEG